MASDPIRVVIVDDYLAMLARATAVLTPTCTVVGTAQDGASALEAILALQPDVAVLDISMPGMSGFEVAANLRAAGSSVAIVFLSVHGEKEFIEAAHFVGAVGYVVKQCLGSDLPKAVHAASAGERFVSLAI
jgi:DNA-binding NarL/FixJ family response regulator